MHDSVTILNTEAYATATEEGIFAIMQQKLLHEELGIELTEHVRNHFCQFRKDAQVEAEQAGKRLKNENITLKTIYDHLAYMNYIPKNSLVKLMDLEMEIRSEYCIQREENVELRTFEKELLDTFGNDYAVQTTVGTIKNVLGTATDEAQRVGIHTGGPILYGYVLWVIQEALRQGMETLFFIARDGYLLKKIADIIIEKQGLDIHTRYLYGSRAVWRVPAIYENSEEFENWVNHHLSFNNFGELIELLHVDTEAVRDFFPEILQKEDRKYTWKEILLLKEIILTDKELFKVISDGQKGLQEHAKKYLQQELADKRIGFVELNGSGFTQYCMQQLICDFYKEPVVTFYYSITGNVDTGYEDTVFYKYVYERLPINDVVEMLTRAPHGQTVDYRKDKNGLWEPVFADGIAEQPEEQNYISYIEGVLRYTEYASQFRESIGEELVDVSLAYVKHICSQPEEDVQDFIGNIPFSIQGIKGDTYLYGAKLTDEQLRNIYLHKMPVKDCYPLGKFEFALLRLTKEQKKKVEEYKVVASELPEYRKIREYICDYSHEVEGRVALYGAGKRGKQIFDELSQNQNAEVVIWADKNYGACSGTKIEISSPEKLAEVDFDYLIIGVADYNIIQEIKRDLADKGIPIKKLFW